MAVSSPPHSHGCLEKKHWWLTNKKVVDMYVKDARSLMATQDQTNITSALNLLDAALALSPRFEMALELKANALLNLRRFKEVADMLQDYIPSLKMGSDDVSSTSSSSSDNSLNSFSRERVKLLSAGSGSPTRLEQPFKCFSVSDLKKKVMASLAKNRDKEGQWRYLILGQACGHLGLMEDAMALLQTGKRLASAAFRRESVCWSDDSFTSFGETFTFRTHPQSPPRADSENICHLVSHIKLLLRRKTAAIAAAEAGLYPEAIRHFSKIVDGRRGAPQGFLAECYMHRASAYRSAGRIAEAIADCNRTLALDPTCIEALSTRASLFETIRCLPDSLHDLEHLKLLYNSILRDRKLPGPAWKRQNIGYNEIPGKLCSMANKIQELKQRVASGEIGNVDHYALMGLRRGCSRSELERAHLLLTLRHKPDKSVSFIDRCEFHEHCDVDSIKDRAKMSALLLYRLIQRGYTSLMRIVLDEEAAEKQRKKASAALQQTMKIEAESKPVKMVPAVPTKKRTIVENKNAFQGVFCRDLAAVGNLLAQAGFNRPITVKYEGLSC
ncbi:dnaJ domain, Tetratricopeptide-like helical domain protein [Artemisia annua]|uniref:DnaJ domain, Tetratricopeptide-like helical domain protein n=1 Tax=Artemisia annua TaxID=35608 RepID=A0A2U1KUS4_ARTAN|nr:dnaJ domain, Tetratricopeptide-like helical domain protein [Artemisia annua]